MSVNIQTPTGLVKISGDKVTKQNIDIALGYTLPNVEEHVENEQVHVTAGEKVLWSNKSDFSGSYSDLTDKPNIDDNESGDLQIADPNGNVIAKVNGDGITTTEVTVNGKQVSVHIEDTEKHITPGDRVLWNNKSDFSGNYADLEGEPESDSDKLEIADESGNVLARFDENGLTTTKVSADDVKIGGKSALVSEDEVAANPVPVDADTLNGHNSAYFESKIAEAITSAGKIPACDASNNGQFLCVVNGVATWVTIPGVEEASF